MEYTKGDWEADIRVGIASVHLRDKDRFNCLDGMRDACLYWSEGNQVIIDGKFDHWELMPEAIANAHLIAAAPDLYEALKEIAVLLANPLTTRQEKTEILRLMRAIDEAWLLAKQALTKVEGE